MTRRSAVYNFFLEDQGHFECTLKKDGAACATRIPKMSKGNGSACGNLKRHIKRHHDDTHEILKNEEVQEPQTKENKKQKTLGEYFKSSATTVQVTSHDLKKSIMMMVAYDGVPLTFFSGQGFQMLCKDAACKLGVGTGRDAVRAMILKKFEEEKEALRNCIAGVPVFLKFDGVTRLRAHYLGISVQFWSDERQEIIIKSLSLVDTNAKHDALHLKQIVESAISDYGIAKKQVLACVVDNASNLTKTIDLLNDDENSEATEEDKDENENNEEEEDNPESFIPTEVHHMRCAEHTLQLAIRDGLKNPAVSSFLTKIRAVTQHLRAPHTDSILKRRAGKGVVIDVVTRWGSTFLMLKRLLELKVFIQDLGSREVHLTDQEWAKLEDMVHLLEIPYKATIGLQKEKLTPGECFLKWKEVTFNLAKVQSPLSLAIIDSMNLRERKLLENSIFLAAVWIDSRARVFLTPEQKNDAKEAFVKMHQRLKKLSDVASSTQTSPMIHSRKENSENDFEAYMDALEETAISNASKY